MTAMFSPGAPAIAASPGFPVTRQAANAPSYRSALDALRWRLFNQGQSGVIYIPRPNFLGQQLLFQDSAGTTPVSADGQPVGLMLDLHKGLVKGPELVANGTFDTSTGWFSGTTLGSSAGVYISGGEIEVSIDTNQVVASQAVDFLTDTPLQLDIDFRGSGGDVILQVYAVPNGDGYQSSNAIKLFDSGVGSFTGGGVKSSITIPSDLIRRDIILREGSGVSGRSVFVDTVSVRELPGNHATQGTAAAKHIYRTDGVRPRVESDGVDDLLQAVYSAPVVPPCVLSIAINRRLINSATVIVTGLDGATRHQLSFNGTGFLIAAAGGTGLVSDATVSEGKHVVTLVLNGANSQIRLDGAVVQTGSLPNVAATGLSLSSVWDGTGAAQQDVYGAIHAEGIDEVDAIEQYLASVSGAIL